MQGCRVGEYVVGFGNGFVAQWHIVTMHKVNIGFAASKTVLLLQQSYALLIVKCVPSHAGHFVFVKGRDETFDVDIENAQTFSVALFGMSAQQLLAYADAKNGILQRANDGVESPFPQVAHGSAGFALSRKYYAVGFSQCQRVVGQHGVNAQASQGVHHGVDVSGIVFDNGNLHDLFS